MKGLTQKQGCFVKEFLVDLNATQAAIRAGYSEKTARVIGPENLSKPVIREAIRDALGERAERTELSADEVIEGLRTEATYHGEGASHGARVSAWSWLGKHLSAFTDNVSVQTSIMQSMTDEELEELARLPGESSQDD